MKSPVAFNKPTKDKFFNLKSGVYPIGFVIHFTNVEGEDFLVGAMPTQRIVGGVAKQEYFTPNSDKTTFRMKVLNGNSDNITGVTGDTYDVLKNIERTKPIVRAKSSDWNFSKLTAAQVAEIKAALVDDAGAVLDTDNLTVQPIKLSARPGTATIALQAPTIGKYGASDAITAALDAVKKDLLRFLAVSDNLELSVKDQKEMTALIDAGVIAGLPTTISGSELSATHKNREFTVTAKEGKFTIELA